MHSASLLLLSLSGAYAFPQLMRRDVAQPGCTTSKECDAELPISDAQAHIPSTDNAAVTLSKDRSNCGILGVCNEFNYAQQYVSTSGEHAFQAPSPTDIRGPCPGLNAAANHGYIARNGILDIESTTEGLFDAYGLAKDFGAFLAVFSIVNSGDVATLQWSIGGAMPQNLLSGVTGTPQGISYSHNFYEGDTSISRCDAYTNFGDAHASSMTRFKYAYESAEKGLYTLDTMSRLYAKNTHRSILQNPYYFAPFVSTTVVSPAAYNFVINFMSNHTKEIPGGYLNGEQLKMFFAIEGDYPNFTWKKGYERIPDNWFKRPDQNPYGAAGLVADLVPEFAAYPDSFRFGGNVNGKNTYTGVDLANVTNGVYSADTILKGDNLGCFLFLNFQQVVPLQLQGGVNDVGKAVSLLEKFMPSYFTALTCPQLAKYDGSFLDSYKGSHYSPTSPPSGPVTC